MKIAAVLLLWATPAVAAAQDGGGAPVIDSVAVHQRNVFDPDEAAGNVLFRLSNAFHIRTQRYVIGQELLFASGDRYDSLVLAETERNLRALGLFREVDIDTVRIDGRLTAVVDAADAWTTTLQADGRSTGDQLMWGIGVKEKNILGTGTLFRAKFRHEVDRNSFTLEASQNRLLGTRAGFYWRWDNLSDGTKGVFGGGVPFRAFADRQAVELDGEWASRRVLQFRDGALDREFFRRLFRLNLRAAAAPVADERGYARLRLDAQLKREEYLALADTGLAVPDTVTFAVGLSADLARARFIVTNYYLAFARDVDVDLSTRLTVGAWLAPSAFGFARNGIGPVVDLQFGAALGHHFVLVEGHANGLLTGAGLDSGQVRGIVTAMGRLLPRQATVLRVEAGARRGTPPSEEFDVGFDRGLRRFPAHAFTGNRELWATVEQRAFLVDALLGLFGLGVAGFVDYGTAWYRGDARRVGGSVGLGLRLSSIRAGDVTMGRLDVAYRFGDGFGSERWVFSFGRNVTF